MLDSRFASKYLICDNNQHSSLQSMSNKLEYIVRLDCLSTPNIYEADTRPKYSIIETDSDYPAAYARIRLHTSSFKVWGDYTNSSGYLRRDKVQARLVELLALAASKDVPNSPLYVDESVLCGIPGKVVDSVTLHNILRTPPQQHVYYGPGGNVPRFPDPRDFRLAIVDEPGGIRLRVEFLSPALSNISLDVRILVAIGVDAWPSSTDFPSRISLGHSDCLLYHQASLTGMYLVGYGVQSSAWQIRVPAAEYVLLNHYGPNSTVRTILDTLSSVLQDIDRSRNVGKQQVSYKILNNYILTTVLFEELEENSKSPISDMINWSPMYLSTHVLKLLDKIIARLLEERQPNYFFKKSNLLVNPGHLSEEDFRIEAGYIKGAMLRCFDESLMSTKGNEDFNKSIMAHESELALLYKWKDVVDGLLPPPGTRGRRFCFAGSKNRLEIAHTQYTLRQLEYIGLLLQKMLIVKQHVVQVDYTLMEDETNYVQGEQEHPLEDVIFILVTIMDQARDQYLSTQTHPNIVKNKLKIKSNYNTCTSKLVDIMRKDPELQNLNFEDDLVLVKIILKWLYRAMDQNKRYLAPILRPYLNNIFATSHAISWHIDSIKRRASKEELTALGKFAEQVNSGKTTPAQGLTDCVDKNSNWAKVMLKMVEDKTLRVVFLPGRGQVFRHILSLPSNQKKEVESGSKTLGGPVEKQEARKELTLPSRSYFSTILRERTVHNEDDITPPHDRLKRSSPLTLIFSSRHRRGEHRGEGDILEALKSMQRLNVFQEVATNLPQEDRKELCDMIRNIQTAKSRKAHAKKWSSTLPQPNLRAQAGFSSKNETVQRYTPKEESAGIRVRDHKLEKLKIKNRSTSSLLGTCRAARIREDSSIFLLHDSFKIKSLLHKSESLKY
ncbi:uncharacterized protein LOC108907125 isoform X2 [Anoplophora glabripennis]|nr:uncharacterized protein LOC108907125 isoform X2 [Anoplophora glabripennis]XP_018566174.1 uncharacterized protein LOC108907125 isoform X2 [Anoplophora glabripennis]